jgi:carboxyl-terminal processing protease
MEDQTTSRFQVRLPLVLAATLAAGMFIGQQLPRSDKSARFVPRNPAATEAGLLGEIMRFVQARYVDTVDIAALKTAAIDQLLKQLDPHSVYITPDEVQAVADEMSGGFEGIGIEYLLVDDTIQVVTPMSGGPSETAGILAGDKIIAINDTLVAGVKIENGAIFKKLRGEKGSQVKIGLLRNREKNLRYFNILRDVIPMKSVDVALMLDQRTGYIKINRFSARTSQEFMEGLQPMVEKQGMQSLVIDLRGNPGGYMNEAAEMLSQLFPEGKLLVYTKGRTEDRRDYKSSGRAQFDIRNVAVLIDEGSASASEIVAGAIQDHDRGWVLGRRSYGKGLVQEQYPLQDGGALRLTVSRYYTPSGRSIQRDYKKDEAYDHEAGRRLQNGELTDQNKIKQADSTLLYYTGMGRPVYGGGGITPDVFIPLDTSFTNRYYYELRRFVPQFAARWMENRNRSELPGTIAELVQKFNVSDGMMDELVAYAEKQGVGKDAALLAKCRQELSIQVKARIAKILFQEQGLYAVLNDEDPAVEKALQLLRDNEPVAGKR